MNFNHNLEKIKEYPEYKLFFLIDECNGYINILTEILKDDNLGKKERNKLLESGVKVRDIRKNVSDEIKNRFGFNCVDENNNPTKEYLNWWHKWNDWRQSFSDEEWEEIFKKLEKNEDIKKYL